MMKKSAKKALTPKLIVMKLGRKTEKPINEVSPQELADLMTVQEAAALWSITVPSVYELIARGRLEKVEFLGRTLLRRPEVMSFQRQKAGRKPKVEKSAG
jgi:excisionase family DNA binding protein